MPKLVPSANRLDYRLTPQQLKFVEELTVDPVDHYGAALRAGFKHGEEGSWLLKNTAVQRALRLLQAETGRRVNVTAAIVLNRWWDLVTADPNELQQVRRVNCRYCHGNEHRYQWTPAEYREAMLKHEIACRRAARNETEEPVEPDCLGGLDFNLWADPNLSCPECAGEGIERIYVFDTRYLSPAGRVLYAGAESNRDGSVKLRIRDQEAALLHVAKHLGMHVDRREVTGANGEPLTVQVRVIRPRVELEGEITDVLGHAD